jgi:hypothetical protein
LKNGVSGRDPALRGSGECSHTGQYAALPPAPRALADGPILVFQSLLSSKSEYRNPKRTITTPRFGFRISCFGFSA